VSAAIAIIKEEGLGGLTTRRLGQRLGVQQMAFYTYFRDKNEILRAVGLELLGRFEIPQAAPSDIELLRAVMWEYFRLLIDNPELLELDPYIDELAPERLRVLEAIHGCLHRLGIDKHAAVGTASNLRRLVFGTASVYPARRAWDDEADHWAKIGRELTALPPDVYPHMHELGRDFPAFTQHQVFEFGLETLLAGIISGSTEHPL
jgi:AcrR family transcriptional regulator